MVLSHDHESGFWNVSTKVLERNEGDMLLDPQLVSDGAEEMAKLFMARVKLYMESNSTSPEMLTNEASTSNETPPIASHIMQPKAPRAAAATAASFDCPDNVHVPESDDVRAASVIGQLEDGEDEASHSFAVSHSRNLMSLESKLG